MPPGPGAALSTRGPQSTMMSSSSGSGNKSGGVSALTRSSSGGTDTRKVALTTVPAAGASRLNAVTRTQPPEGNTRSTLPSACPQPPDATSQTGTVKVRWNGCTHALPHVSVTAMYWKSASSLVRGH